MLTTSSARLCDTFHSNRLRDRKRDGTSLIAPIGRPLISMIALAITRGMGSMSYDAAVIASHVDARTPEPRCRFRGLTRFDLRLFLPR